MKENVLEFHHGGKSAKRGENPTDAWRRMLMHIYLVEEAMANSIISSYPTLKSLHEAYKRCLSDRSKHELLADILVERTGKNGVTQRRIGPSNSKRIHDVIMGRNPNECIR